MFVHTGSRFAISLLWQFPKVLQFSPSPLGKRKKPQSGINGISGIWMQLELLVYRDEFFSITKINRCWCLKTTPLYITSNLCSPDLGQHNALAWHLLKSHYARCIEFHSLRALFPDPEEAHTGWSTTAAGITEPQVRCKDPLHKGNSTTWRKLQGIAVEHGQCWCLALAFSCAAETCSAIAPPIFTH